MSRRTDGNCADAVQSVARMLPAAPVLEVAVHDLDGAGVAVEAGADQIELCSALSTGGLTPSIGLVESAAALIAESNPNCGINVLVRPRSGGFAFVPADLAVACADIRRIREIPGVTGIVVGALDRSGAIDRAAMERLVAEANDIDVVFHRAIDVLVDPRSALDDIIDVGCRRVLSSGGHASSAEGCRMLAAMVAHVAGQLQIMAGGGVRVDDIPLLLDVGVSGVHLSAKKSVADGPVGPGGGSAVRFVTDSVIVRSAKRQMRSRDWSSGTSENAP